MIEAERKFLIDISKWTPENDGVEIIQGYLLADKEKTVRIRVAGIKAFITVKGKKKGISRPEYEYEIPVADAAELLSLCEGYPVEKTRYMVKFKEKVWEIDVFEGMNIGLVLAEIELKNENERFELPLWVTKEVTDDIRYYNSYLSKDPFSLW